MDNLWEPNSLAKNISLNKHNCVIIIHSEVPRNDTCMQKAAMQFIGYPEDIRKKLLAARCMNIAQSGQYNYPRVLSRGDNVAAALTEAEFIRNVISAVYLLNNRYMPFYKWMYHGVRILPILGQPVGQLLQQMTAYPAAETAEEDYFVHKIELMQQICAVLISELQRQGLSASQDISLLEHGMQVHQRIAHEGLRASSPWMQ